MRIPIRAVTTAVVVVTLVACTGGSGTPPSTSVTGGPSSAGSASGGSTLSSPDMPGATSSTTAPRVPSAVELADHLVTPADLGPGWSLWEGFTSWPGGVPGVIPDDQRTLLPTLPLCPRAGQDAEALVEDLQWQVFTQMHQTTSDQFATMVVAQQLLLADEPDRTAATFATLRDGLNRCLTRNLPAGEWEIGLREPLEVPAVGDNRFAERSSSFDPGGARRETRLVLVQQGAVFMVIQIHEILITPEAAATLTPDTIDAVVTAMADKLP